MGTQQLLLIVLGTIVIAIAIAVGITLFNHFAYRANISAMVHDLQDTAVMAVQYWALPLYMGGASKDVTNIDYDALASYCGFSQDFSKIVVLHYEKTTPNGRYRVDNLDDYNFSIISLGVEKKGGKYPFITAQIDIRTGEMQTTIDSAAEM